MTKSLEVATLEINSKRLGELTTDLSEFEMLMDDVPEILGMNRTMDVPTFTQVGKIRECLTKYRARRAEFGAEDATKLNTAAKDYFNACMTLRCSSAYHTAVGSMIQYSILQAPTSTHLITCGNSHLTCADPLHQFIGLDTLHALGWVDASQA
jgi:hypothetical protein